MKLRVYVDTSVIGGCLDAEFEVPSRQLFGKFRTSEAIMVVSDLTLLELEEAPEAVRAVLEGVPQENREDVELTTEAAELAERYISAGVVIATKRVDAQHIAIAVLTVWTYWLVGTLDTSSTWSGFVGTTL